jgi:hypothetical protein
VDEPIDSLVKKKIKEENVKEKIRIHPPLPPVELEMIKNFSCQEHRRE